MSERKIDVSGFVSVYVQNRERSVVCLYSCGETGV